MQQFLLEILAPILMAIFVVGMVQPCLVKIALAKSIVDNPGARKLNKRPVPVLGGVGVFIGIVLTVCVFTCVNDCSAPFVVFAAALMMLYTGVADDILNMRAMRKLILQIIAVAMLIWLGGMKLDSLHGLWGVYALPDWISIPVTLFAGVGIINAINLIDGVDGLSSGYGIMVSLICGLAFFIAGRSADTILSFAILGSLIPFFIHNCFGRKYKMYIGDGGSLSLGLLFFVIITLFIQGGAPVQMKGVVSFLLALFSVPVFDTLRVMISRILKRRSPFSPDKTHLHHLFIEMGYNHPATTRNVVTINFLVVAVWLVTDLIDAISIDAQFYIVVGFAALVNLGLYFRIDGHRRKNPEKFGRMRDRIAARQRRRQGVFLKLQRTLDKL